MFARLFEKLHGETPDEPAKKARKNLEVNPSHEKTLEKILKELLIKKKRSFHISLDEFLKVPYSNPLRIL